MEFSVGAFGDGTESQTVTPSKLAAAGAAGVLHRFSAARETPELYTATAAPARDAATGRFSFSGVPSFTPNRSPEEVLRAGAFGGAYYRPIVSLAHAPAKNKRAPETEPTKAHPNSQP